MSSLTRWVLAHKRTVVGLWVALTIAGMMAAGPATDALENEYSVPDKEGWETNEEIAAIYSGTGGDTAPLMPVVTLPEGESVDSEAVQADLAAVDEALAEALPSARIASYASTGDDTFVSEDGGTTFAVVYPTPDPNSSFGENPEAEKAASAALEDTTVAGQPVHLTGFDALFEDSGADSEGPGLLLEALDRRRGRPGRPRLRVRLAPRGRPVADGDLLDHDHVPAAARTDRAHHRLADRAVPDRAARPGRRDRLFADRRLPLARGAHART